ncbi:MAG: serine/threonine protein kinase, partial [Verrucomicrobiaceae bacterium]|nr:serine/threonine protein kinase [Verrucomicrobiaceae bacterium]
ALKKRQEEMTQKGNVDKAEVDKLLKRSDGEEVAALDPKTLTPAVPDKPFTQPLRLEFAPLPGTKVLFGKTEVMLSAWQAFTKATGFRGGIQPAFTASPHHPVVGISWDEAQAFCTWLTDRDHQNQLLPAGARYRLPRDTEWSVAAGLGVEPGADPAVKHLANKSQFPWGDGPSAWPPPSLSVNIDANNVPGSRDSFAKTAPVGSLLPTKEGIHDLGGNVGEWCEDPWPGAPEERVIRGGSWISSTKEALYSSVRQHQARTFTRYDLGFRLVVDFGS